MTRPNYTTTDLRRFAENQPIQPVNTNSVQVGQGGAVSRGHEVPLYVEDGVIPTQATTQSNEPVTVALDDMKEDLENLAIADRLLAEWTETRRVIRERIANRLGPNGIGTFQGRQVWAHTPTDRFAAAKFAKEQPEIAAQFTEPRVVTEVNQKRLEAEMPVLFADYRVSSLRPLGSRA